MTPRAQIRRRLVGGSIEILLAESLSMPAGILVAAYMTRQLGPAGYGLFALAASLIATAEWFITAMLSRASIKLVAETDDWRGVAVALIRRHLAIGLALGAACWATAGLFGSWLDTPGLRSLLRLAAVQIPIVAFTAASLSILVGRGLYRPRAISRAARWVSRLIFVVVFVGMGYGVRGAILAGVCAALMSLVIAHVSLAVNPFGRSASMDGFWRLALAVFTTVAGVRLLEKLGLLMVKAFGGTVAEVGYYAAAQNFTLGPGLFTMSVAPLLISAIAQAHRDDNSPLARVLCRDALRGVVWLLPIGGLAAGAASEVVTLVYGPLFTEAAPLARYLVFGGVALAGLSVTSAILAAYDRANWAVIATAPVLPVAAIGYFLIVPRWGGVGAAAVTTAAAAVGFIGTLVAVHRLLGILPPRATLLRAALVTAFCWVAAAMWPTPGMLLVVKVAAIGAAGLGLIVLLGEVTPGEFNSLWSFLPWGRRAGGHDRLTEPPAEYLDAFMAAQKRRANLSLIERWIDLPAGGRVLKTDLFDETRAGEGFFDALGAPGRRLVGMDISEAIAGLALERLAHSHAVGVVADVRHPPFLTGSFDLVISNSTLDHFGSKADIDTALVELARVTRPGGVLIVTLDNPHNVTYPLLRVASAMGLTPFFLGETYSRAALCRAVERAGLVVTDTRALIHNPRLLPTTALLIARRLGSPAFQRAVHRMQQSFERLEGTRWQYLTGCFVAVRAEKPASSDRR